ncbi:hypothetical protein GUJ93_ZPchr0007g3318 [Zizania palustris]|uniref:Uncharacterized protein n=1 Tax=Zizania palustris TaxID=103762 RepID=A0A8J5W551_ZIZPA|nr:hypothetical protein GUJ93_ZPchr0007g3318 [Zizania palustris]
MTKAAVNTMRTKEQRQGWTGAMATGMTVANGRLGTTATRTRGGVAKRRGNVNDNGERSVGHHSDGAVQ